MPNWTGTWAGGRTYQTKDGHITLDKLPMKLEHPEEPQEVSEEVQLAFRLHHPAIAQVHHLKVRNDMPHVIAEYVDGPTLNTVISLAAMRGKPVSAPFALYIAAEVADALHHAHTLTDGENRPLGIIHRDVSPRNIRVAQNGAVKLTHFGAAYSRMVGREETPGLLLKGDVAYASPEYLHRRPMDGRSDLFSLGLLLVEMLTSRHLFDMEDEKAPATPGDVKTEETPSVPLSQMMALVNRDPSGGKTRARSCRGCCRRHPSCATGWSWTRRDSSPRAWIPTK